MICQKFKVSVTKADLTDGLKLIMSLFSIFSPLLRFLREPHPSIEENTSRRTSIDSSWGAVSQCGPQQPRQYNFACSSYLTCSTGRYWVQKIQEELLLISSMGQSALAIAQLRHTLYSNPEFMTTAYCLEDLFYHRMHHEWRSYCTLTSFLDKVQQAQTLGKMNPPSSFKDRSPNGELTGTDRTSNGATIPSTSGA
jgi:hypothetical protein